MLTLDRYGASGSSRWRMRKRRCCLTYADCSRNRNLAVILHTCRSSVATVAAPGEELIINFIQLKPYLE